MASPEQRRKVRRRVLFALMALSLSLLAGTLFGSGGFSSCCYDGNVGYERDKIAFGILDAHDGNLGSSHCSASTALNDDFAGAAATLNSAYYNDTVNAFWFLTSYYHGQNTCGFTGNAYEWGQAQATMFVYAVALSGYTGPVAKQYADVEHVWTGPQSCSNDLARWRCDNQATNRWVLLGFADQISSYGGVPGFYSSPYQWADITGPADASTLHAYYFWFAFWGADQGELNITIANLNSLGFTAQSWQYATDDVCETTFAIAKNQTFTAFTQGHYIYGFDMWDNDNSIFLCY
ncbi:MAG: hypothetical protein WEE64_09585 [Dehalococcoidia bacterium]